MNTLIELIKQNENNPNKLSELHLLLGYRYAELSQGLTDMLVDSTQAKKDLLIENKTVAKANQLYELSDLGIKERKIKIEMKSIEKLLSSVRRRLTSLSEEAKNQY